MMSIMSTRSMQATDLHCGLQNPDAFLVTFDQACLGPASRAANLVMLALAAANFDTRRNANAPLLSARLSRRRGLSFSSRRDTVCCCRCRCTSRSSSSSSGSSSPSPLSSSSSLSWFCFRSCLGSCPGGSLRSCLWSCSKANGARSRSRCSRCSFSMLSWRTSLLNCS